MIGMMYLVLTALLALNVSKDILDAFVIVNKGLENSNLNFTERNEKLYADFDLAKTVDPVLVTPNWKKAQDARKESEKLVAYIDELQKQMITETEKVEKSVADTLQMQNIENKDKYDIPTNIMIGDSEDGSKGASRELKNKLIQYRELLTGYILPVDRKNVKVDINTDDPKFSEENENWELYNFYDRPLVACLTILSKLKNDVKNSESLVVDYLLKQTDGEVMKFDTVAAKVVSQSNYVLLGGEYKADVFLAAFSKTKKPEITIGENIKLDVKNGLGKYTVKADKEGIVDYEGMIRITSAKGKESVFPFKSQYIVARPSLTVSLDAMNVMYPGLDNPVSISVPGIPTENLSVSATGGTLIATGSGKYNVKVSGGTKVDLNVFATMDNGEKKNMGTMSFRVRPIPKPKAKFWEITDSGVMSKSVAEAQQGLIAQYDNFVYNITAKVTSFKMIVFTASGVLELQSTNNMLTPQMKEQLKLIRRNSRIMFEDIQAVGPGGAVKLSPLTIKIN
ncbi:MAG: hypothetical protein JWO44_2492 [Bacteroidetes bacterium]|nr:hypothetical protein [Bacteroidota bacterium]